MRSTLLLTVISLICCISNAKTKNLDCKVLYDNKTSNFTAALQGERSSALLIKKIGPFDVLAVARDSQVDLIRTTVDGKVLSQYGGDGNIAPNLKLSTKNSDGKEIEVDCSAN